MPSVEFEVWCSCGAGLCNQTSDVRGGISIEPCESCLEKKYNEGHADGHYEGEQEGHTKGYEEGHKDGLAENE